MPVWHGPRGGLEKKKKQESLIAGRTHEEAHKEETENRRQGDG